MVCPLIKNILKKCEKELGLTIATYKDITPIPSRLERVYFVEFKKGMQIKIRTIFDNSNGKAERMRKYIHMIDSTRFPRILITSRNWVAMEWIDGIPLWQTARGEDLLHQAACFLATIHKTEVPFPSDFSIETWSEVGKLLDEKILPLLSHKVISRTQATKISSLYENLSPNRFTVSLIHGDFSPHNLISSNKALYSVDNIGMRIHFLEYDLSRAINSWDEWRSLGDRFFDIYIKYNYTTIAREDLLFWIFFDLVYRINYRISSLGEFDKFYINKLQRLLAKERVE